jgi:hypothetical protein
MTQAISSPPQLGSRTTPRLNEAGFRVESRDEEVVGRRSDGVHREDWIPHSNPEEEIAEGRRGSRLP